MVPVTNRLKKDARRITYSLNGSLFRRLTFRESFSKAKPTDKSTTKFKFKRGHCFEGSPMILHAFKKKKIQEAL